MTKFFTLFLVMVGAAYGSQDVQVCGKMKYELSQSGNRKNHYTIYYKEGDSAWIAEQKVARFEITFTRNDQRLYLDKLIQRSELGQFPNICLRGQFIGHMEDTMFSVGTIDIYHARVVANYDLLYELTL